jgi:hypothetical protein
VFVSLLKRERERGREDLCVFVCLSLTGETRMMMMMMMMMIRDAIKKLLVVVVRRPLSSSSASSRPRKTCFFFWACRDSSSCRLYAARDKRNATRFLFPITSDLQKVDSGRDGALERRRRRRRPIDTKPRHRALLPLVSKPHERRDVFFAKKKKKKEKDATSG